MSIYLGGTDIKDLKDGTSDVSGVYLGGEKVRPSQDDAYYYSDKNRAEYQSLVNSIGSVKFVDTGKRCRFHTGCYIGNRMAVDVDGNTFRKINLDTLSLISSKGTDLSDLKRIWYFGDNRILTYSGIMDFDGNMVTTFSTTYDSITPGLPGVVWANKGYDIYKGIVDGDNITFTKIGTGGTDQTPGEMAYGRLGAYLINRSDTKGSGYSSYVNPETNAISNFPGGDHSRATPTCCGPDGKMYRLAIRYNGRGRLQKIGTGNEGFVGTNLSTDWIAWGHRFGKFLGNIVSGGAYGSTQTGDGYGSNNYFINTSGSLSLVQSNAFAYDTSVISFYGFVDEKGWIYPYSDRGGNGVILKTNKTFTDFNWKNPYLYR